MKVMPSRRDLLAGLPAAAAAGPSGAPAAGGDQAAPLGGGLGDGRAAIQRTRIGPAPRPAPPLTELHDSRRERGPAPLQRAPPQPACPDIEPMTGDCVMPMIHDRRHFLAGLSAAGATGILDLRAPLAAEPPPEVTTIRLLHSPTICVAPDLITEALLRAEGFTDIRYIADVPADAVARGVLDFQLETAAWVVANVDAGQPIVALTGLHVGCYELFAHDPIRTISDLKGRRVGIPQEPGSSGHMLLTTMAAQVGLDPHRDIDWITIEGGDFLEMFVNGEVDAFLGFPPEPQELRARNVGRVILNTATDRPWSQYFCCIAYGHPEFVRAYPIATKRYLRALLKAADLCAREPEIAARQLVEAGFTGRYDFALEALTDVPYDRWREYDPEDALRFYALRLHQVGMISSTPEAIIARGTDWRFLDELKRELKA
jgi:NitT/TauT family transport system substrate-binding protein